MNQAKILECLQEIFDSLFLEKVLVTPLLSASDVKEWDSLNHINIIVAVERTFEIRFRVGEVETTNNLGEFIELILARIMEKKTMAP